MTRRNNAHDFPTNRDRDAFGEVLNRTPKIGYAKGQLWRIEFTAEPLEHTCDSCGTYRAEIRVVWNYGEYSGIGSDTYCWECVRRESREWLDRQLDELRQNMTEYRNSKQ